MTQLYVAFYRGHGHLTDWVIRKATRSDFSHVELIRADERPRLGEVATCLGASGRDGGVRIKEIRLDPEKWRIYHVRWAPDETWERAEAKLGEPFDLLSMLTTQLFNFRRGRRGRWCCSELVAYALGLDMPHAYSPGDLLRAIGDHHETHDRARVALMRSRGPSASSAPSAPTYDDEADEVTS